MPDCSSSLAVAGEPQPRHIGLRAHLAINHDYTLASLFNEMGRGGRRAVDVRHGDMVHGAVEDFLSPRITTG